ncbi:hypothetical protein LTR95_001153 [Oleoguttula sp. CCFEE 5521]
MAIALGYEHQVTISATPPVTTHACIFHSRAIGSLRQTIVDAKDIETPTAMFTVVFNCLLLVILQCFRKSFDDMSIHLQHGLRIAVQSISKCAAAAESPLRDSFRLLKQYYVAATLFNPLSLQRTVHGASRTSTNQALVNPEDLEAMHDYSKLMTDDQALEAELQDLILGLIATTLTSRKLQIDSTHSGSSTLAEPLELSPTLLSKIPAFRTRHEALELAVDERLLSKDADRKQHFELAKMRCLLIGIYLRCRWSGYQCHYDTELESFGRIVELAESHLEQQGQDSTGKLQESFVPPVSTLLGLGTILSFTARMCRQHALRHRAVGAMQKCPDKNGPWDAKLAIAICKAIIAYEELKTREEDIGSVLTGYIPEHCRVHQYYYHHCSATSGPLKDKLRKELLRVFRIRKGTKTEFLAEEIELEI